MVASQMEAAVGLLGPSDAVAYDSVAKHGGAKVGVLDMMVAHPSCDDLLVAAAGVVLALKAAVVVVAAERVAEDLGDEAEFVCSQSVADACYYDIE